MNPLFYCSTESRRPARRCAADRESLSPRQRPAAPRNRPLAIPAARRYRPAPFPNVLFLVV